MKKKKKKMNWKDKFKKKKKKIEKKKYEIWKYEYAEKVCNVNRNLSLKFFTNFQIWSYSLQLTSINYQFQVFHLGDYYWYKWHY